MVVGGEAETRTPLIMLLRLVLQPIYSLSHLAHSKGTLDASSPIVCALYTADVLTPMLSKLLKWSLMSFSAWYLEILTHFPHFALSLLPLPDPSDPLNSY